MFLFVLLILLAAVVISTVTIILVKRNPGMKIMFQIFYAMLIIVLGFLLVRNIMQPISFKTERIVREKATIKRLKDIRTAQVAYKDIYGNFTGSFDTLIAFVKTDSFELESFIEVGKWHQDVMTKEDALKKGILKRSVQMIGVNDSLFKGDIDIDALRYIPYAGESEFVMGAGELETGSKVTVQVFEAYALFDTLFQGMNRQLVVNYKDERYKITKFEGIKVGSLTEATNNAGNWEK